MYLRMCCVISLVLLSVILIIIYPVIYPTYNTFALQTRLKWMDPETKKFALQKAEAMVAHIGYADELIDDKKLEDLYAKLEIDPDDYYNSDLNITLDDFGWLVDQFRKPVNKSDWIMRGSPAMINALYNEQENSMEFPAGILQGIFFDHNRPQYMNYGAIGLIIGHEITHGFDDQGRHFDHKGNLVHWWETRTEEEFTNRAFCFIRQYKNYTVEEVGEKLDAYNTVGENMADSEGTKIAYQAYKAWVRRNGREPKLPGLNFTQSQLFWISAAQPSCTVERPESLKYSLVYDPHSPSEFRVNGAFSNQPEFVRDFNCPEDSNMNRDEKCQIW